MAHGIGGRTVQELSSGGMSEEELLGWAAFLTLEPFPEDRADIHHARVMAQQYNMNRGRGRPAKPARDFLVDWHRSARPAQTVEQMEIVLRDRFLAWGGDPRKLDDE